MKYELSKNPEHRLGNVTRIVALKDFSNVKKGEIGGFVSNENNLSQYGDCWLYGNSKMFGNCKMFDNSKMFGYSEMHDYSEMHNNSEIHNNSKMHDNSKMFGYSKMHGYSKMDNNSEMHDNSKIFGNSKIDNNCKIFGNSKIKSVILSNSYECFNISYLKYNLTITKDLVFGGCKTFTHNEFKNLILEQCEDKTWKEEELNQYKSYLDIFLAIQKIHNPCI